MLREETAESFLSGKELGGWSANCASRKLGFVKGLICVGRTFGEDFLCQSLLFSSNLIAVNSSSAKLLYLNESIYAVLGR